MEQNSLNWNAASALQPHSPDLAITIEDDGTVKLRVTWLGDIARIVRLMKAARNCPSMPFTNPYGGRPERDASPNVLMCGCTDDSSNKLQLAEASQASFRRNHAGLRPRP